MKIIAAGATDIGRKRAVNEDCFGIYDELGLYVVADGMGGHAAGEVASRMAVDTIRSFIATTVEKDDITWPFERDRNLSDAANRLVTAVRLANQNIHLAAQRNIGEKGMGATVVAVLAEGSSVHIAHAGDSRAYLFSGGRLMRLTEDHSYVEEMVRAGVITPEQARKHPMRNIVTRALGTREDVKADISDSAPKPGDVYLICTDGLSGMLTDGDIETVMAECADAPSVCAAGLVAAANNKGGDDNITAIVLRVF